MSQSKPPSYQSQTEYAEIEAAMLRTEKGRAFLADYLKRNRLAETDALLASIGRLQRSLSDEGGERRLAALRRELVQLRGFLSRLRRDLAMLAPAYATHAVPAAGAPAEARQPAALIAEAADAAAEAAAMLQEAGADARLCQQIERQLEAMRAAARAVEMNRQRSETLSGAFWHIEAEIMAMLDLWDHDPKTASAGSPAETVIHKALQNGLAEELTMALLKDAGKTSLFH